MTCEWDPDIPSRLSARELAAYRAGRDALLAEAGDALGGGVVVVET